MAGPTWLDLIAKLSEIVGALAGVLALAFDVLGKGKRESHPGPGLVSSAAIPRGWLRVSMGLFCIPLLALALRAGNFVPGVLRASVDAVAAAAGLAALLAFGMHFLRLRRQQLPLPDGLIALLARQFEDSRNHQYGYLVGSAPPILDIYVDQWTEWRARVPMGDGGDAGIPLSIAQMLEKSWNVIVLAEPGVGKSTAINQVIGRQSAWWRAATRSARPRDAPYGPFMPVVLPPDLHGCHRLPDAMARQWEQVTGLKADPRMFGRKPPYAKSWLVLIDGVDQILSTPARTEVLVRLGGWVADTSAPYRFMITSRPLLSGELGPLKAEHVGRFILRKFDADGLGQFAHRWAAFRESQHFGDLDIEPLKADRFTGAIKAASLWPLARVPLIATITALLLEASKETALPASRAGLYERFVQHLFSSRRLEQLGPAVPAQLAVHGRRGERAWAWLLDNLRDLLEGVADLHLSGSSPGVSECAIKWVLGSAPAAMFEAVPGWDDAVSGLLMATSLIIPSPRGLLFAHPNFAEYLAAGPRGKDFDLETWLADVRSPDSRSLALFVLARQARDAPAGQGPRLADRLTELLLDRGGAEACLAGDIIADGIQVAPALRARVVNTLFELLERDDEATEALTVLVNLVGDAQVLDRLVQFSADPAQHDWSRADAAEELCAISRDAGIGLLRQVLEGTTDSLLQHRILLRLAALNAVTADERATVGRYGSALPAVAAASEGARAGYWYRRIARDEASEPGRRVHAALAMAERRDPGWEESLHAVVIDPRLPEAARLDAGRRAVRLAGGAGPTVLRRITDEAEFPLEVRVPLLAAMAEAQDEQARRVLNQLSAKGGAGFRKRFPSITAWREEVGTRSSDQPAQSAPILPAGLSNVPFVWGNVPPRNENFTGRLDVLDPLRASRGKVMAVQGLGGVGKTAIAVEYVYRYRADYQLVWWIAAEQIPSVRGSLAALASRMGPQLRATVGIDGAIKALLEALCKGEPFDRWLLIFDNADQPEEIIDYIPSGPGDVLITSRNHRWRALVETLPIDVLTRVESTEFLVKRTGGGVSAPDAGRIADALGDLPLALEQAGAMLAETRMPAGDYLRLLDEQVTDVMSMGKAPDYPHSMTAAWQLAADALTYQLPQAMELLRVCAFLGPEPIPRDIFRRAWTADSTISEVLADPIMLARAIRELGRFGLVVLDGHAISAHRLIKALIRDGLTPDERARYQHEAHLILASAPENPADPRTWPRYYELLPHVASNVTELGRCPDARVRDFANGVLRYLYLSGDLVSCRDLAERLIGQWTQDSGPDDPAVLHAHSHLGNALRLLGRYPDARRATEEALTRARQVLGPGDPLTLALMNSAAADLRAGGDFAAALSLDQESRDLHEQVFGAAAPQTLRVMGTLALDRGLTGACQASKELGRLALSQATSTVGMPASDVLSAWINLAWILRLGGSFREALDVGEEAWQYGRESLGPEHYATLLAGTEVSIALRHTTLPNDALALATRIADQSRVQFGDAHPVSLAAAISLANSLAAVGQAPEALPIAEGAVAHYSVVYGSDHPLSHASAGNLALLRRLTGDAPGARHLDETALAGLRATLGPDHCYTLTVAANLASDLAVLGDLTKAREVGEDTLARAQRTLGADHFLTLGCAANLALDLRATGSEDNAIRMAKDATDRLARALGPDHPQVTRAAQDRLSFSFDPPPI